MENLLVKKGNVFQTVCVYVMKAMEDTHVLNVVRTKFLNSYSYFIFKIMAVMLEVR